LGSIQYPGNQSSLYLYIGSQLLDGSMPYRDIFDFHAPLVFLINALGLLINDSFGVWLIELHFLIGTLIIIFVILTRSVGPLPSLITCLILAGLIGSSLEGGNRIEEYALLFQALGLAGFLDCFTRRRLTLFSVYLIGLSGALTFWLKPALTVFWFPFLVIILVLLARKEGLGIALTRLVTIIFSAALVFIVMIPWLYLNNALAGFSRQAGQFYQNLIANVPLQEQLDALGYFGGNLPFLLIVCISLALIIKLMIFQFKVRRRATKLKGESAASKGGAKAKSSAALPLPPEPPLLPDTPFGRNTLSLVVANFIAALLLLYFTVEPGLTDGYLTLQLLMCLVIPLAAVVHRLLRSFVNKERLSAAFGLLLIVLMSLAAVVPGITASTTLAREQREESPELIEQQELVEALRTFDVGDEPLIVFGDDCWVYDAVGSYSATRYAYQPFSAQFRADLQADFYRQVKVADAQILVGRVGSGLIELYPNIDDYERVYESPQYEVYRRVPEPEPES
jgi:hypothetical protein